MARLSTVVLAHAGCRAAGRRSRRDIILCTARPPMPADLTSGMNERSRT